MADDNYGYSTPGSGTSGGAGTGAGGADAFTGFLSKNPALAAGVGIGAATLPLALNKGNNLPYQGPLTGIAQQASSLYGSMGAYAGQLESPIISGQLPPGAKAQVDLAQKKADTQIKSRYANLGLTGSTMEADQLAQNEQNRSALEFQIEQDMAKIGLTAGQQALESLKLEDTVYGELMKAQMAQDKGLTDAIGGFAKAAGSAFGLMGKTGGGAGGAAAASGGAGGDLLAAGELTDVGAAGGAAAGGDALATVAELAPLALL